MSITFIIITLLSFLLFYIGTGKDKRVLFLSAIWITFIGSLAYNGFFENTESSPPRFLLVFAGAVLLTICFYHIVDLSETSQRCLFAIHVLRIPVEIGLYQLFLQKQVPVLMTFQGWNFDVVVGFSALLLWICRLVFKRKVSSTFLFIWNIIGIIFLFTIVAIAVLSAPLPIQQLAFEQPNIAVLKFPFILLPAYIVPVVLLSHLIQLKILCKHTSKE